LQQESGEIWKLKNDFLKMKEIPPHAKQGRPLSHVSKHKDITAYQENLKKCNQLMNAPLETKTLDTLNPH
jgi:hypothetical protein